MKSVKFEVTYQEPASRLELLIRWLWLIPTYVVIFIFTLLMYIVVPLQWLHILFLGKRHKVLNSWMLKYSAYYVKFASYFMMLTDERSPIIPEDL